MHLSNFQKQYYCHAFSGEHASKKIHRGKIQTMHSASCEDLIKTGTGSQSIHPDSFVTGTMQHFRPDEHFDFR